LSEKNSSENNDCLLLPIDYSALLALLASTFYLIYFLSSDLTQFLLFFILYYIIHTMQHKNIATTLQKYFIARLQHCNVKMSVLKILIRNIAATLQHNIYAILDFARV